MRPGSTKAARAGGRAKSRCASFGNAGGPAERPPKLFAVYCEKGGARRYLFRRCATRDEAERVAAALRNIGCRASVAPVRSAP